MLQLNVVAKIVAKRDCVEDVKAELLKLIAPTRKEIGCMEYNLHQDREDPSIFIFYETWNDAASLGRHKTSDHYKAYASAVNSMIEKKVVNILSRIE